MESDSVVAVAGSSRLGLAENRERQINQIQENNIKNYIKV